MPLDERIEHDPIGRMTELLIGEERRRMLLALGEGPRTTEELSTLTGLPHSEIQSFIEKLIIQGFARFITDHHRTIHLTDRVAIQREGDRIRIRIADEKGDFVQFRFRLTGG